MDNQRLEATSFIDPFWVEHGQDIRQMKDVIISPQTQAGKNWLQQSEKNTVLQTYKRLQPILASLVCLVEYGEIEKAVDGDYFADPLNQRMTLRSFSLLIDQSITSPYEPNEQKGFADYRPFFEGMLKNLRGVDLNIQNGHRYQNFINSLFTIFLQQVNNGLEGVDNFDLSTNKLRNELNELIESLPKLRGLEEGQILRGIRSQLPQRS